MTRTSFRIVLACAVLMAGGLGCGSSSFPGGGGGQGGSAGVGGATGGTTGAAGTTDTGGTTGGAGTTGAGGTTGGAGTTGAGGATGGADGGAVNCVAGAACTGSETCAAPCGGGNREIACFCEANAMFACQTCVPIDAGAGGAGGSTGTDGGVLACPANPMGGSCDLADSMCSTPCAGGTSQDCRCQSSTGGGPDGGNSMRWRCQNVHC